VAELLKYCAGLPLALSIVAGRALTNPHLPLSALVDELRNTDTRLSRLAEDPVVNVRAVLSWSYHALDADPATLFALLGIAPGPDIERRAAASLAGWTDEHTDAVLHTLERASLVQQPEPGRYRMHDLIRLYATECAADLPADAAGPALRRLADFYAYTAVAADDPLSPVRPKLDLAPPVPGARPLDFAGDKDTALRWYDAEHANLLAAQDHAASQGWHRTMWLIAWAFTTYHHWRGRLAEDVTAWEHGVAGAQELGDPVDLAFARRRLGYAYAWVNRHDEAQAQLEQALALAEAAGDRFSQAKTYHGMSQAWGRRGDDRRSMHHANEAVRLFEELGLPAQVGQALIAAAWPAARLGEYEWARSAGETALELCRKYNNTAGDAEARYILGYVAQHTDRLDDALEYFQEALLLLREVGNLYEEADALYRIGHVHAALGDHALARAYWQRALARYREHHRTAEAERTERNIAELG